jgi:hypothetical protein
MPTLGETKSTVFDPGSTGINPVEAARREMAMRQAQNALILQRLRQQSDIANQELALQRDMPEIQARSSLIQQGGTGMDMARMMGEQSANAARIANEPRRDALDFEKSRWSTEREDQSVARAVANQVARLEAAKLGLVIPGDGATTNVVQPQQTAPRIRGGGGFVVEPAAARESAAAPVTPQGQTGAAVQAEPLPVDIEATKRSIKEAIAANANPFERKALVAQLADIEAVSKDDMAPARANEAAAIMQRLEASLGAAVPEDIVNFFRGATSDGVVSADELARMRAIGDQYKPKVSAADAESLYRSTLPGAKDAQRAASYIKTVRDTFGSSGFTRQFKGTMPKDTVKGVQEAAQKVIKFLTDAGVPQAEATQYVSDELGMQAVMQEVIGRMNVRDRAYEDYNIDPNTGKIKGR